MIAVGGQPIETAPKDRLILVWAPSREGLKEMFSLCQWHPDAGFCIDELRSPELWWELPIVEDPVVDKIEQAIEAGIKVWARNYTTHLLSQISLTDLKTDIMYEVRRASKYEPKGAPFDEPMEVKRG